MANFPNTVNPRSVKITSIHQNNQSISQNLTRFTTSRGGHRWSIDVSYPLLTREQYAPIWAFLVGLKGRETTFQFTLPEHQGRGSYDYAKHAFNHGTLTSSTTGVKVKSGTTGRQVVLEGFGVDANLASTNVFKAGDFIRFSTYPKTYMITADALESGGECTINIEPALIRPAFVSGSDTTIRNDGMIQVALTEDDLATNFSLEKLYSLELNLMEQMQ